jgi:hypothetical protein
MSDLFMTSPLIIDAPIVLASGRSSHGREIGGQWNFSAGTNGRALSPAGPRFKPSVEPRVDAAGIESAQGSTNTMV